MNFAGMNPVAIGLAAVAALLWGVLFSRRVGFLGATAIETKIRTPVLGLFVTLLVADTILAWVLAGTLGHLGVGQVTLKNGLISALFVWAGFIATTVTAGGRLRGASWSSLFKEAFHWLGAVLLMGAVIGGIGV